MCVSIFLYAYRSTSKVLLLCLLLLPVCFIANDLCSCKTLVSQRPPATVVCRTCSPSSTLVCCCAAARDSPLAVICLRSLDTRRVAAIRGRQCRRHNVRRRGFTFDTWFISSTYWDWLTVQQRGCVVDWCGRSLAPRGLCIGGRGRKRRVGVVNLDIWPPIAQQVRGQLAQTGLSGLAFPLQTPHPSAQFLLIRQRKTSSCRWPVARLLTDACRVTLIPPLWRPSIFKGECRWPVGGRSWCAWSLPILKWILRNAFVQYFLKLQQYDIMHNDPAVAALAGGRRGLIKRARVGHVPSTWGRRHRVWNSIGWWRRKNDTVSQLAYEYNRWHRHKAQLHTYLCCMSPKVEYKITRGGELIMRRAPSFLSSEGTSRKSTRGAAMTAVHKWTWRTGGEFGPGHCGFTLCIHQM